MKTTIIEKIARIIKNKKRLETLLQVKITNSQKNVNVEGSAENEFVALSVLEALNYGMPFSEAIKIKTENKTLQIINIKEYANQKNLLRVRGRVIGQNGKALKTISNLTDSSIEILENTVAIVTLPENLERTTKAIIAIIKGAKHGAVYKELEHNFPENPFDLGLKETPLKTMEEYKKDLKKLNKKL